MPASLSLFLKSFCDFFSASAPHEDNLASGYRGKWLPHLSSPHYLRLRVEIVARERETGERRLILICLVKPLLQQRSVHLREREKEADRREGDGQ